MDLQDRRLADKPSSAKICQAIAPMRPVTIQNNKVLYPQVLQDLACCGYPRKKQLKAPGNVEPLINPLLLVIGVPLKRIPH